MLQIKSLKVKTKSGIPLIEDVSFSLKINEKVALIGSNGVGKTTILESIMGISNHDIQGDIKVDKKDVKSLSVEKRAQLGIFLSLQSPPEVVGVSFMQFLYTAYNSLHKDKPIPYYDFAIEVVDLADALGLEDIEDRNLNEGFSGGEKKKSEILQMLILKPKYILLDEIEAGLDVKSRPFVLKKIKELQDVGLLFVTHTKETLEYLNPNRILLLESGKIKELNDIKLALKFFDNEAI